MTVKRNLVRTQEMECVQTVKVKYPVCKCGKRLVYNDEGGNVVILFCPECQIKYLEYIKHHDKYVEIWYSTMVERNIPDSDDISDLVR